MEEWIVDKFVSWLKGHPSLDGWRGVGLLDRVKIAVCLSCVDWVDDKDKNNMTRNTCNLGNFHSFVHSNLLWSLKPINRTYSTKVSRRYIPLPRHSAKKFLIFLVWSRLTESVRTGKPYQTDHRSAFSGKAIKTYWWLFSLSFLNRDRPFILLLLLFPKTRGKQMNGKILEKKS